MCRKKKNVKDKWKRNSKIIHSIEKKRKKKRWFFLCTDEEKKKIPSYWSLCVCTSFNSLTQRLVQPVYLDLNRSQHESQRVTPKTNRIGVSFYRSIFILLHRDRPSVILVEVSAKNQIKLKKTRRKICFNFYRIINVSWWRNWWNGSFWFNFLIKENQWDQFTSTIEPIVPVLVVVVDLVQVFS